MRNIIMIAFVITVLALAGCSGGDDNDAAADSSGDAETASTSTGTADTASTSQDTGSDEVDIDDLSERELLIRVSAEVMCFIYESDNLEGLDEEAREDLENSMMVQKYGMDFDEFQELGNEYAQDLDFQMDMLEAVVEECPEAARENIEPEALQMIDQR